MKLLFHYIYVRLCLSERIIFNSHLIIYLIYLISLGQTKFTLNWLPLNLQNPPALTVFVSSSTHWGKGSRWKHKGTVSINISCWSFSLLSLWIKLLISCYSYCRQQQVISAEILLCTDEWLEKYTLSSDLLLHSRNFSPQCIHYLHIHFLLLGYNGLCDNI